MVVSITEIFENILTPRGRFCSVETGIPVGPDNQAPP